MGWARCWAVVQPRHFGHVLPSLQLLGIQLGAGLLPDSPQASAMQPARTKPQIIIIEKKWSHKKKLLRGQFHIVGASFTYKASQPRMYSSLGNDIMRECNTVSIRNLLQHCWCWDYGIAIFAVGHPVTEIVVAIGAGVAFRGQWGNNSSQESHTFWHMNGIREAKWR